MTWKSTGLVLLVIYNDIFKSGIKLALFLNSAICCSSFFKVVLICQIIYSLHYALNREKTESCKKALFNLAYFVNALAILSEFSFALLIYQT